MSWHVVAWCVLGVLFLYLIGREIAHGPAPLTGATPTAREPAHV